jgi:hypothetical protein
MVKLVPFAPEYRSSLYFTLLPGNRRAETGSLETPSSSGESIANLTSAIRRIPTLGPFREGVRPSRLAGSRRQTVPKGAGRIRILLLQPAPLQVRTQRDTQEPNAPCDRKERFEQCVAELFEFPSRPDLHLTGAASRDLLEVSEFDLERDCAAAEPGALAVPPNLVDDLSQRVARRFVGEEIGGKCVLGADRFSFSISADRPLVDAARNPVVVGARFPEMLL